MSGDYMLGLFWILVAGTGQGAFLLPMKFVRRWKWEHLWLVYSGIAFFALPLLTALITVPHLRTVITSTPGSDLIMVALFGMGWGAGSVFFGLAVDALGMALGFSLATGIYTALGALVPMAFLTPALLLTRNGVLVLAGNVVTVVGVVFLAAAGARRDKEAHGTENRRLSPKKSFAMGLTICVLSGVFSAMLNFVYAFGGRIADVAVRLGSTREDALNALWLIALPAGGAINVLYCIYLIAKHKSVQQLFRSVAFSDVFCALLIGILWTGSVVIYGWGANRLGLLGPSLGWSMWNAITIVVTVVCGLLTHEWRGVGRRPLTLLLSGVALLILAAAVLGVGGAGE